MSRVRNNACCVEALARSTRQRRQRHLSVTRLKSPFWRASVEENKSKRLLDCSGSGLNSTTFITILCMAWDEIFKTYSSSPGTEWIHFEFFANHFDHSPKFKCQAWMYLRRVILSFHGQLDDRYESRKSSSTYHLHLLSQFVKESMMEQTSLKFHFVQRGKRFNIELRWRRQTFSWLLKSSLVIT